MISAKLDSNLAMVIAKETTQLQWIAIHIKKHFRKKGRGDSS